jgi:hypothetical protein
MNIKGINIKPAEEIRPANTSLLAQLKETPTIVFCFPGKQFSGDFLRCWTATMHYLLMEKVHFVMSTEYSSMVHLARAKCLSCNVFDGQKQKIFNGINYTHIMWIDSDIVWMPEQIGKLLLRDVDVVSGLYSHDGEQFVAYKNTNDVQYFKEHGGFESLTLKDTENVNDLIEVAYSGMGFMMVKKGVFESLAYPYFTSEAIHLGDDLTDIISEDTSFCMKIKEKDFKIFIDPLVEVGHEKSLIVRSTKKLTPNL